ncbi:MAG TPA: hypothetical protein VFZ41_11180 [Solirubrobacterales bacterium]
MPAALIAVGLAESPVATATDGDLRTSFSRDGRVITDLEAGSKDFVSAADNDADGRLVVAGTSIKLPQGGRLAVARYLGNGSLDPSFGTNGVVVSDAEGGMVPSDITIDESARIVVAGGDGRGRPKVARLLPDGRFDPTLGGDGLVRYEAELEVGGVALDHSGRLVLGGGRRAGGDSDFAVSRLQPDGTPDRSLGGTGLVAIDLAPGTPDVARDVLVDGFGRIVLAGGAWLPRGGVSRNVGSFALARLQADGRLDDSMRGTGVALIAMNRRGSYANAMVPHGRGNVVLAGNAPPRAGFVKVRGAGGLDKRFGQRGRAKLAVRGGIEPVALDNGRNARLLTALGASRTFNQGGGPLIGARLLPFGAPDRSFSDDSRVVTGFGRWSATARTVVGLPFGDVAIAGSAKRTDHHDFAIARYEG